MVWRGGCKVFTSLRMLAMKLVLQVDNGSNKKTTRNNLVL